MNTGIRLAADLDAISREEIERLRAHNFTQLVTAARRTPAVLRRWPGLDSVHSLNRLPELPVLTPSALADGCPPHSMEFLIDGDQPGMVLRSSGTSSKVKMMYHSWAFNEQVSTLGARGLRATLPEPPHRVANCLYGAELNGSFLFTQEIARLLGARVYPLGNVTGVADTAKMIAEHAIDTLAAPPGYGVDLLTSTPPDMLASMRTYLYIGESLGASRTTALTDALPELTVRSLAYSTTETGPIGYQCQRLSGNDHHVHEDAMVVEIVDEETGRSVPDGEEGEVLVTPLSDTGMALFRYAIGDRGRLSTQPCRCGSQAAVLTLLGRARQSLNVDSETVSADQLMARLARLGITDPADCQLQVLWAVNRYRVRLLLSPSTPKAITADAVVAAFADTVELNQIVTGPRCLGFTVEHVERSDFERTERGKVPTLYQRLVTA
ncbi:phenylacetate--CoA ligase family protein [Streptomyces cellulosae]|uniref:phenylacetate--CoA ligase family protein n=1 Tax=Streptomyces cellulosae TaxID=1968 RepID=UPI00068D595C|nr:AMP-binding protein [Streptomyces cellulosae]